MSTSNSSEFNPNSDDKKIILDIEDEEEEEETNVPPQSPVYRDLSTESSEPRPEQDIDFDLNKEYQPWTIIDTYFRDNNYYKSQHQIDSFNEFITSDDNGIRMIIKRKSFNYI